MATKQFNQLTMGHLRAFPPKVPHCSAFSLIEATIVLILMAMGASLFTLFSLNSLGLKFYNVRENLKGNLRRVKNMALNPLESATGFCSAAIQIEGNRYLLFYNQNCDGAVDSGDFVVERVELPPGVILSEPATFNFKIPYGEVADKEGVDLISEASLTVKTTNSQYQSLIKITPLGQVYQQ